MLFILSKKRIQHKQKLDCVYYINASYRKNSYYFFYYFLLKWSVRHQRNLLIKKKHRIVCLKYFLNASVMDMTEDGNLGNTGQPCICISMKKIEVQNLRSPKGSFSQVISEKWLLINNSTEILFDFKKEKRIYPTAILANHLKTEMEGISYPSNESKKVVNF